MRKVQVCTFAAILAFAVLPNIPAFADAPAKKPDTQAVPSGWLKQNSSENPENAKMPGDPSARIGLSRMIVGILELEKGSKNAITKGQAASLKPVLTKIKNNGLLDQVGFNMGPADETKRDIASKAMESSDKLVRDSLSRIESILNAKQLGAIDGMNFSDFPGLQIGGPGGGSGGSGGSRGAGVGEGAPGGGSGGNGDGIRPFGGQKPNPKEMDKMRKEMEKKQKETSEKLDKALVQLIKLVDRKNK